MILLREGRRRAKHRGVVFSALFLCLPGLCLLCVLGTSSSPSLCRAQLVLVLSELGQHGFCLEKTAGTSPGVLTCTEKAHLVMGKGSGGICKRKKLKYRRCHPPLPLCDTHAAEGSRTWQWWHLTWMSGYHES